MSATIPSIASILEDAREHIVPVLLKAVQSLDPPTRALCEYHFGWREIDGTTSSSPSGLGKNIRSALVFLSANAIPGYAKAFDVSTVSAAAASVELVHNFSLVHDDIMDGDSTRRHRRTVWAAFGRPEAILAGDALMCLGFDHATDHPGLAPEIIRAVQLLINGQFLDLEYELRSDVDLPSCLRMVELKTAALTAAACAAGGLVAGGSERQIAGLRRYGRDFGMAFQFADDLLGIDGVEDQTGKPRRNDLWRRKRSLPVVYALNSKDPTASRLKQLYCSDTWTEIEVDQAYNLILELGALEWASEQAVLFARAASAALDAPSDLFDPMESAKMEALVQYAATRHA
jgi:geranylgeranyl diphosphate synthase type I